MELQAMLTILASQDGSDLYLSTGAPPCAKFQGALRTLTDTPLAPGEVAAIAADIMDEEQRQQFDKELEMNLAISLPQIGRFRVNIFKQRNEVSLVARNIKTEIPRFEDLKLPPVLLDTIMEKRGLVLFVGGTGSGKSTSLAALIDHRNRNSGNQALDRIINFFPEERRPQLLNDLGNNLKAFVSQRLVKTTDGGRRAAVEVMLGTHTIRDLIKRGEFGGLKEVMEKSRALGMVTFDEALFDLVVEGVIEDEEAVKNADSQTNLRLKIKLWRDKGQIAASSDASGWSLEPTRDQGGDPF